MSPAISSVYVGSAAALPGERLISLELLATDRAAIPFAGLPEGITSRRRLTETIETALRCMGVSEQAITLARKLAEHTRKQDWQAGNRPIVWPSNLTLRDQLGVGERHLRRLILELREHGVLVMVDSGNRKRFGRRNASGQIMPGQAFGFDLSTWATCYGSFAEIVATHRAECAARADARRTIKTAKRQIDLLVRLAAEGGMTAMAVQGDRAAALQPAARNLGRRTCRSRCRHQRADRSHGAARQLGILDGGHVSFRDGKTAGSPDAAGCAARWRLWAVSGSGGTGKTART
jgi:Replication protein C N-terminal domain